MCTPGGQQSGNPRERYLGIFLCILPIDIFKRMWYNGAGPSRARGPVFRQDDQFQLFYL